MQSKVYEHVTMAKSLAIGFALGCSLAIVLGTMGAFIAVAAFGALESVIHFQVRVISLIYYVSGGLLGILFARILDS